MNAETSVDAQAVVAALDRLTAAIERSTIVKGGIVNRLDTVVAALMMHAANAASFPNGKMPYPAEDIELEWNNSYAADHPDDILAGLDPNAPIPYEVIAEREAL